MLVECRGCDQLFFHFFPLIRLYDYYIIAEDILAEENSLRSMPGTSALHKYFISLLYCWRVESGVRMVAGLMGWLIAPEKWIRDSWVSLGR